MVVSFTDLPKCSNHILVDGAFDPLHAGHVAYLEAAAKLFKGKPILCSVASDEQIRQKGREPLLPQASRVAVLEALSHGLVNVVHPKDRPTEFVIEKMAPRAYVKGADWQNRLPPEQESACIRVGAEIVFVPTPKDSSTDRLRAWALTEADRSLDRLEAFIAAQSETPIVTFDREYFTGGWRKDAEPYTWDGRKKAEGRHPKIVKECFEGLTVLDVGCGPGYFVRMLREVGMDAGGIDPSKEAIALSNGFADRVVCGDVSQMPPKIAHVAICREVLEHLAVWQVGEMIADLFRVARKFVYITTRFSSGGVFDAATDLETDPTHITCLTQPFVRSLCVLNGGKRRKDLEDTLDHQRKGRVLVYELT